MSVSESDLQKGLINDQIGQQLESISAQVEANLERGRNALAEWRATLHDSTGRFRREANRAVRARPWEAAAAAAAVGLLVGILCARR